MGRRRVRLLEQERPEGPHLDRLSTDSEQAAESTGARGDVLRLQETAGNEAVSRMLVQRDPTTADEAVPADSGGAVKATLVLDDRLGVLPLLSFSKGQGNEYNVIVPSTDKDPDFWRYFQTGVKIDKAKISTQGYDIELDDVYISFVKTSQGGGEHVTEIQLSYAAANVKRTMP